MTLLLTQIFNIHEYDYILLEFIDQIHRVKTILCEYNLLSVNKIAVHLISDNQP